MGKNLRFLRKLRGLSQQQLADAIGIKRNNVSAYESGTAEPRALIFIRLANYLSIHPTILIERDLREEMHGREELLLLNCRSAEWDPHVRNLLARSEDMEKVIEGFREFYKQRRNLRAETGDGIAHFAQDFENLVSILEQLLITNRELLKTLYPDRGE